MGMLNADFDAAIHAPGFSSATTTLGFIVNSFSIVACGFLFVSYWLFRRKNAPLEMKIVLLLTANDVFMHICNIIKYAEVLRYDGSGEAVCTRHLCA